MNGLHTTEVGKSFGVVIVVGDEFATFRRDVNLKNNVKDFKKFLHYMSVDKKEIEKFNKML